MDVVLALVAAFFFALGLVLQEQAARTLPEDAVDAGFLIRLAREPLWLLGIVAQIAGFVAQAIALGIGRIVIVQPLLIATIVFALPLGRLIEHRRIARVEWLGAAIVAGGLGVLLVVSRTSAGVDDAARLRWALVGGATVGLATALFLLARGRAPSARAGLLGTAAGILFGLSAALTKTVVATLDDEGIAHGVVTVVEHWHVYALVAVSIAAFWLEQAALQTGALAAAVATTMAFDPLSSLVFGAALFDETLHETTLGVAVSTLALGATLLGLVLLARAKQGALPAPEPEPALAGA